MRPIAGLTLAFLLVGVGLIGYALGADSSEGDTTEHAPAAPAGTPGPGDRAAHDGSRNQPASVTTTSSGRCDGALVQEEVREVTVPDGATCVLVDTVVGSNVSLGRQAAITLHRSRVGGDVEGEDARALRAHRSRVGGNLQLEGGGSATLVSSHVDGDVEWQEQRGRLAALRSSIGGNLELDENTGPARLIGNRIDGDLECDGNRSLPTGTGNVVRGHRAQQCRRL